MQTLKRALRACVNLMTMFEASLRLLHPVMPFITEEIWHALFSGKPPLHSIALATYPQVDQKQIDSAIETNMAILQDLIVNVRNARAELKIEPKTKVPIQVYTHELEVQNLIRQNRGAIERLANVERIDLTDRPLIDTIGARRTARFDVHVVYEKKIDVPVERERLRKRLEQIEKEIANGQRQLSNEQFLVKAPANVVEGMRKRGEELAVQREKIQSQLGALGG